MAKNITSIEIEGSEYTSRPYGVCNTARSVEIKSVIFEEGDFSLVPGATILVKFVNANTHPTPKINVGGTGSNSIFYRGQAITAKNFWKDGEVLELFYDGTDWNIISSPFESIDTSNFVTSAGLESTLEDFMKTNDVAWGVKSSSSTVKLKINGTEEELSQPGHVHSNYAITSHASSATTYGTGTESKYGHVKVVNGDLKNKSNIDGQAAGLGHSHSNYSEVGHVHILTISDNTTTIDLMEPGRLYRYTGGCTSITVAAFKTSGFSTAYEEYMLEFKASTSGCTLSLPTGVIWVNNNPLEIIPGKIHQVSIVNNLAVGASFG